MLQRHFGVLRRAAGPRGCRVLVPERSRGDVLGGSSRNDVWATANIGGHLWDVWPVGVILHELSRLWMVPDERHHRIDGTAMRGGQRDGAVRQESVL